MRDRDFLIWIHERLTNVHNEPLEMDYMNKLRSIIDRTPITQETPNVYGGTIEKLKKESEISKMIGGLNKKVPAEEDRDF